VYRQKNDTDPDVPRRACNAPTGSTFPTVTKTPAGILAKESPTRLLLFIAISPSPFAIRCQNFARILADA
jgi:hypothetical protein